MESLELLGFYTTENTLTEGGTYSWTWKIILPLFKQFSHHHLYATKIVMSLFYITFEAKLKRQFHTLKDTFALQV